LFIKGFFYHGFEREKNAGWIRCRHEEKEDAKLEGHFRY
jgi:hypothetical protein